MENLSLVDYSRQSDLHRGIPGIINRVNIIIGCGGVGFWLGLLLAMIGLRDFILVEGSKIDASNLNRLPVPQTFIGINKAIALRKTMRLLRPNVRCTVIKHHFTKDNLNILEDMVKGFSEYYFTIWDTTDDARIQSLIYKKTKQLKNSKNIVYKKIGYDGWIIGNYSSYDVWFDEKEYNPGYRHSMANAITSAMAAGFGIFSAGMGRQKDFKLDLGLLAREGGHDDEK